MGYKILGMAVWKGSKWYIHRKVDIGAGQKAALVMASAAVLVGAAAAGRHLASDDS